MKTKQSTSVKAKISICCLLRNMCDNNVTKHKNSVSIID